MDTMKTGLYIRQLREGKNLTQRQLAENLYVSPRTVSRWETGRNLPDFDRLILMGEFFAVPVGDIITGGAEKDPDGTETARYAKKLGERARYVMNKRFLLGAVLSLLSYFGTDFGMPQRLTGFCGGAGTGILLVGAVYTSALFDKISAAKIKFLKRIRNPEI